MNALDGRFDGRDVLLIEVQNEVDATVLIDGLRDCKDRSWLGFAQDRARASPTGSGSTPAP